MSKTLHNIIQKTGNSFYQCGLEKEGLRVAPDMRLSKKPHPHCLGSALTHAWFTTDYSENLVELVSPVMDSTKDLLSFMHKLHAWLYRCMPKEDILWPGSMPCIIDKDEDVPIASFGSSAPGLMRYIYRRGLGIRYGRKMQTIAGMHFNISFVPEVFNIIAQADGVEANQEFISKKYMATIRNFHRYNWLIGYLFGASPLFDESFLDSECDYDLQKTGQRSKVMDEGLSARMSDIGYTTARQGIKNINKNSLDEYLSDIRKKLELDDSRWEAAGLKDSNGEWQQLSTKALQAEFELYGLIRPKSIPKPGERPLNALNRKGIEYLELRSLDINPYEASGASVEDLDFLVLFMLFCLLEESPPFLHDEREKVSEISSRIMTQGRRGKLRLECSPQCRFIMEDEIESFFEKIEEYAKTIANSSGEEKYLHAVKCLRERSKNIDSLTSSRIHKDCSEQDYVELMHQLGKKHRKSFESVEFSEEEINDFRLEAERSILKQVEMEKSEQSFEEYLHAFMDQ